MKVIFRASRIKKVTIEIPDNVVKLVEESGFDIKEFVLNLAKNETFEFENISEEDIDTVKREISRLERELFNIEGKWASLKFQTYGLTRDNKNLSIQISGMIAENKRLREMLGLPPNDYTQIKELIRYYLNIRQE
ncbi:hypothetical protein [Pyrococcus sp. ST04]|uniref:hypothetical protein n=1 Tax=Pyrococcus sp. ST04 TaxID=1183377 RepID=UPI0002605BE1|nr:hypothetical protein [Pyrococcus sp. ST04]AFK22909.1 hypothetical protein Py04_1335 [Pyrococcus sp. ST04]